MTTDQFGLVQLGEITPSKLAVATLATQISEGVKEGLLNPIDTAIHLNAVKQVCEDALKLIVDPVLESLEKGKAEKWGCKIEQAEVGVKYDYSQNSSWVDLKTHEEAIAAKRKELEDLLKHIPAGKSIFNDEGIELIGASRTSTTSFKTTLAR
jgi:hypothetical protein